MPVSCTVSTKKTKTKTQIICESMEKVIDVARKEVKKHAVLKKELEYEPDLLRLAIEKGLMGGKEEVRKVLDERKLWKDEIKSDVKTAVMAEKQRIKQERKAKRKSGINVKISKKPQKRRRSPGRFV